MQSKSSVGETRGYHLFLMPPDGSLKDVFRSVIARLAQEYGGPVFEPHITLAAEINAPLPEIISLARRIAEQAPPRIAFQKIETGTAFFTCCYLSIEKTPQLSELNRRAREQFPITGVFNPHLSLAYGIYPADVTQAMATLAEQALKSFLTPTTFPTLEIWETKGRVDEWKVLSRYSFAG